MHRGGKGQLAQVSGCSPVSKSGFFSSIPCSIEEWQSREMSWKTASVRSKCSPFGTKDSPVFEQLSGFALGNSLGDFSCYPVHPLANTDHLKPGESRRVYKRSRLFPCRPFYGGPTSRLGIRLACKRPVARHDGLQPISLGSKPGELIKRPEVKSNETNHRSIVRRKSLSPAASASTLAASCAKTSGGLGGSFHPRLAGEPIRVGSARVAGRWAVSLERITESAPFVGAANCNEQKPWRFAIKLKATGLFTPITKKLSTETTSTR